MTEDYLHYVWKFSLFNQLDLKTTEEEHINIQTLGIHNHNSGPDFLDARLSIAQTKWAGNVEIHINTSDWDKHKHQSDKAYNNVVLHVVYNHDKEIYNQNGEIIPTLELKNRVDYQQYFSYERFLNNQKWIPCENAITSISSIKLNSWLDRVLLERMEKKAIAVLEELKETNGDWDEVFYRFLFRYFGMKVNGEPMFELARRTPFTIIQKESKSCFSLEALLFGQSGMLNEKTSDSFHSRLRDEYLYQKQKYGLTSMRNVQWKFSKLRPPNFSTIRIAQLAMLYSTNSRLFQLVRNKEPISLMREVLKTTTSKYWESHYVFSKTANKTKNTVGDVLLNNLLINVVAPICVAYGKSISDYSYIDFAIELLKKVRPEENKISNHWSQLGLSLNDAFTSQAFLELYECYCSQKKCLNCSLGIEILNN